MLVDFIDMPSYSVNTGTAMPEYYERRRSYEIQFNMDYNRNPCCQFFSFSHFCCYHKQKSEKWIYSMMKKCGKWI